MNDVSDTHTVSLQNYAGLGHLLQAAGVSPDRAEAMVLGLLANPGQDLQISQQEAERLCLLTTSALESFRLDQERSLDTLTGELAAIRADILATRRLHICQSVMLGLINIMLAFLVWLAATPWLSSP